MLWDAASTHRAKAMKTFLQARKVDQVMIPAGMTGFLQSLDTGVNRPFKQYMREEVHDYIENRSERNSRGNFIKPKLSETVNRVKNAWDKATVTTAKNSLIARYLYESATFEETYIVKNTEYGHEILKRIIEENSDFQNETGTDMIDVLEDDETVIDDN